MRAAHLATRRHDRDPAELGSRQRAVCRYAGPEARPSRVLAYSKSNAKSDTKPNSHSNASTQRRL